MSERTDNKGQDMNFEMKLSYKNKKLMKKLYGKNLGREIAYGRNLIKLISKLYQPERSKRENFGFYGKPIIDQLFDDVGNLLPRCGGKHE